MFQKFLNFISYIFPIISRRESLYSNNLSVVLVNGKKVLNARRVNYSHGSLHKIMRFALEKAEFKRPWDILMLGLWGWSAIELIRKEFHLSNLLRVVDIDSEIIKIAKEEFAMDSYSDLEIVCQDAYDFVREDTRKYELIIVDIFINNGVPEKFYDDTFWENIFRILSSSGQIIFNTMIETTNTELFQSIITRLERKWFVLSVHERVRGTNMIVIANRQ